MNKTDSSAHLARNITRSTSLQTFVIIRWLVDKGLVDDCYRAYAYFRWVDNIVDDDDQSANSQRMFIQRQLELLNSLNNGKKATQASPEERMLVDLVKNNSVQNEYLQSYIYHFFKMLEFDIKRRDQLISKQELSWYSKTIAKAVTDAIFFFIGNGNDFPKADVRYYAAEAAHITHMLRDYIQDVNSGYFNMPQEYLQNHALGLKDVKSAKFRSWVKQRVKLAREYFNEGKKYIDRLPILRTKIAAYWFCTRFESILDTIEKENYNLRVEYGSTKNLTMSLRMAIRALKLTFQHILYFKVRNNGK